MFPHEPPTSTGYSTSQRHKKSPGLSPVAAGRLDLVPATPAASPRRVASPWLLGHSPDQPCSPLSARARHVTAQARKRLEAAGAAEQVAAERSSRAHSRGGPSPRRTRSGSPRRSAVATTGTDKLLAELERRASRRLSPRELSPSEWVAQVLTHGSFFDLAQAGQRQEQAQEQELEQEQEQEQDQEQDQELEPEQENLELETQPQAQPEPKPEPEPQPEVELEPRSGFATDAEATVAQRLAAVRAAVRSPGAEAAAYQNTILRPTGQPTPGAAIDAWLLQMPPSQWNPTDLYAPGSLGRLMDARRGLSPALSSRAAEER